MDAESTPLATTATSDTSLTMMESENFGRKESSEDMVMVTMEETLAPPPPSVQAVDTETAPQQSPMVMVF